MGRRRGSGDLPALEQALADPVLRPEPAEVIRSHIERITLTPNEEGTLDIRLHGETVP